MLSEISQTEKAKYDRYDLSYMWNLNKNKNQAYRYIEQIASYQRPGVEGKRNG